MKCKGLFKQPGFRETVSIIYSGAVFELVPELKGELKGLRFSAPLTREELSKFVEFIEHKVIAEGGKVLGLSNDEIGTLRSIFSTLPIKDAMRVETESLEKGTEEVFAYPNVGAAGYFSRTLVDACWDFGVTEKRKGLVPYIFATRDSHEIIKLRGGVLLMESELDNGEKVFIIRGMNPLLTYLNTVDEGDFFEGFVDQLEETAEKLGISKIIIPIEEVCGMSQTNRPPMYDYIQKTYGDSKKVRLKSDKATKVNGYSIKKSCVVVRQINYSCSHK